VPDLPWHIAVTQDGIVVAVLQEQLLEIRTVRDEYNSVVGRAIRKWKYTLSEAWSGVNWADLMAAQGLWDRFL